MRRTDLHRQRAHEPPVDQLAQELQTGWLSIRHCQTSKEWQGCTCGPALSVAPPSVSEGCTDEQIVNGRTYRSATLTASLMLLLLLLLLLLFSRQRR